MKSILRTALAATIATSCLAHADDAKVARLVKVSGNVLVSSEYTIASAGEALRLAAGMRVLVTANSAATVEYTNGCRVRLAAGERFEVRPMAPCAGATERLASNATARP